MNAAFPGGAAAVLAAPEERLEESIRCGGLSKMKASRIHALLRQVQENNGGELSLEHLRDASTLEAKTTLQGLKGLGPKSVACILAFTLDRDDLAVDTHGAFFPSSVRSAGA
jgi:endonuclease III